MLGVRTREGDEPRYFYFDHLGAERAKVFLREHAVIAIG
jgi:hypothetical protein